MANTDDWCHQYLSVTHDPEVERLTQIVGRDRRNLPMTVMMFEAVPREPKVVPMKSARIVRVFAATKFSYEWVVCHEGAQGLELLRVEVPFKQFSKTQNKVIEKYRSGQLISFEVQKVLIEKLRITLGIDFIE